MKAMEDLQKELLELKTATEALVDLVDPIESSSSTGSTLVEWLRKVPHQIVGYLAENSRNYVAQVLGHVKSYWPSAKIALLGDGMYVTCDDGKFAKYVEEAEPVADQIVKMLEQ